MNYLIYGALLGIIIFLCWLLEVQRREAQRKQDDEWNSGYLTGTRCNGVLYRDSKGRYCGKREVANV